MAAEPRTPHEDPAAVRRFVIDAEQSTITFAIERLGVQQVEGRFLRFDGTLHLAPEALEATRLHLQIEADSVETGDAELDASLSGPDLLAAQAHAAITFDSTGVRDLDVNAFALDGELTLRGTTRAVTLETTFLGLGRDPDERRRALLFARGVIDRTNFGVEQQDGFQLTHALAADEVQFTLDLQAVEPGTPDP